MALLEKTSEAICNGISFFTVTEVKLMQYPKAPFPILVTLLPMVTEVKPVHPVKALFPMDVTLLGMVTEVKPLQYPKAHSPMDVTLLGIVTEVKPLQSRKALFPMDVTLLGIIVFLHPKMSVLVAVSMIALQLFLESNFGFPDSTTIVVKPQPEKALSPMDVTLWGIITKVKPLQP